MWYAFELFSCELMIHKTQRNILVEYWWFRCDAIYSELKLNFIQYETWQQINSQKILTFWCPPQAIFLFVWSLRWISFPFLTFSKVSKPRLYQNTPKKISPAAGFFGYLRSGMQKLSNPLQQLLFLQNEFVNTDTLSCYGFILIFFISRVARRAQN